MISHKTFCPHHLRDNRVNKPRMKTMGRLARVLIVASIVITPALSSAATFTHTLSVGSRDAEVASLQQVLGMLGFLKVTATGYFGVLTKQAVMAFQKQHGLEQVGIVGPKTRVLLFAQSQVQTTTQTTTQTTITAPSQLPATTSPQVIPPPIVATSSASVATSTSNTAPSTNENAFVVSLVAPASVLPPGTLSTIMTVATNKNAYCRWGTIPNMLFQNMTSFVDTGKTTHTYTFANLSNGSLYVYYVKCEDAALNISADTAVSFSVGSNSSAARMSQLAAAASSATSLEQLASILRAALSYVE